MDENQLQDNMERDMQKWIICCFLSTWGAAHYGSV